MKRQTVVIVAGLAAVSFAALQAVQVKMNGASVNARRIDGSVYVKLADVAKAFDMHIITKGSNFELVPAGGANMLQGTKGKLGEELFTGKWRFLVKDVQRTQKYMLRFANSKFELDAFDQELIVVTCRFKNGVRETVSVYFNGLGNTAITDMEGRSFKTFHMDTDVGSAEEILPGAAKEFAVIFRVPKGAEIKDMIYTIEAVDLNKWGATDLRISLKP